jgi:arylsulfatase
MGKTDKSARRDIFSHDETDLMAIRVDGWKMDIGVKHNGDWFDSQAYPSVPYITDLLMEPMEKITPDAPGFEYEGRKFVAEKLWAPTAAGPFLAPHLKSLEEFPPRQGADTLSMKSAADEAMRRLEAPNATSNCVASNEETITAEATSPRAGSAHHHSG